MKKQWESTYAMSTKSAYVDKTKENEILIYDTWLEHVKLPQTKCDDKEINVQHTSMTCWSNICKMQIW